jgi:hypothetical protein
VEDGGLNKIAHSLSGKKADLSAAVSKTRLGPDSSDPAVPDVSWKSMVSQSLRHEVIFINRLLIDMRLF